MRQVFGVAGMTCGGCARAVERAIKRGDPAFAVAVRHGRVTAAGVTFGGAVGA
jgi:copper chaperone CopZ